MDANGVSRFDPPPLFIFNALFRFVLRRLRFLSDCVPTVLGMRLYREMPPEILLSEAASRICRPFEYTKWLLSPP